MKLFKFKLIIIIYLALSFVSTFAQQNKSAKPEILHISKFIKLACKNDLKFQEIIIDQLALAYQIDLLTPSRDLVLGVTSQYNYAMQSENNSGIESAVSLSKLFPDTGTELSAAYSTYPANIGNDNVSAFTFMISQPIAANAFGNANRLQKKIIGLQTDISRHQIIEAYEDYLASLIAIYYQWYNDYANMQTAQLSLKENNKLLYNVIRRKKSKIADQSDVDKIRLQVIKNKETLLTIKEAYQNRTQLIYQAITYRGSQNFIPKFTEYKKDINKLTENYQTFLVNSRSYKVLELIEKKGDKELKYYADQLLPSLNLLLGYTKEGLEYTIKEPEDTLFTGFSFSFSFWKQKENAAYKISEINLQKSRYSILRIKTNLKTELKNLVNKIELEKKMIKSAEQKIILGKRVTYYEIKKYHQARTSLSNVIETRKDLENYKFNKISHDVKLNLYVIELLRLCDRLVEKNPGFAQPIK